jgi:hypothetical protein
MVSWFFGLVFINVSIEYNTTCTKSLIYPQNLVINFTSNSFCIANLALFFMVKANKKFVAQE